MTDALKHAARLRNMRLAESVRDYSDDDALLAGAEALEAQGHLSADEHETRLAKHLDHSDAYFAEAAEHLVRIEAIHERIASALEMLVRLQGRQ